MKNPFIYGKVVKRKNFANRKEEIEILTQELSRGRDIILFSPRRYGKTSLILNVLAILKERDIPTVYMDLYPATTKQKLVQIYAKAISSVLSGNLETILVELKDLFTRLIPKISIGTGGGPELEYEFTMKRGNIDKAFEEAIEAPKKVASKSRKNVVVALDEFQEIDSLQDGDEIERLLRTKIQHHDMVSYVFSGSKRHLMDKMFGDKNRPLYRIGTHMPLRKISLENFEDFIISRFREGGFKLEKSAVQKILKVTEGHPYYTQMLSSILWELNSDQKKINYEEVETALDEALAREEHAYTTLWDSLTIKQKRFIEGLCIENSVQPFSGEFVESYSLGSPSTVQRVVKSLMEYGVIEKENETYSVADVFFKEWVIRKFRR